MTAVRYHPCPVCGRSTSSRHDRCRECARLGRTARPLFCTCDVPEPQRVRLFDVVTMDDAYECGRCGRPIL